MNSHMKYIHVLNYVILNILVYFAPFLLTTNIIEVDFLILYHKINIEPVWLDDLGA